MFRFITPIIIIGISIAGFFLWVTPLSREVALLKEQTASYNQALDNAVSLERERDRLTQKYNAIPVEDLNRLQKLLPDNVDNIRLILEIEKIASPYGMVLKDIKYNVEDTEDTQNAVSAGGNIAKAINNNYGVWDLEFSTEGSYTNFLKFMRDLENNLRIIDISTIQFSSDTTGTTSNVTNSDVYKYGFKIKTYWMKN